MILYVDRFVMALIDGARTDSTYVKQKLNKRLTLTTVQVRSISLRPPAELYTGRALHSEGVDGTAYIKDCSRIFMIIDL